MTSFFPHFNLFEGSLSASTFRQVADAAPVMIWTSGTNRQFRWLNRYGSSFTGATQPGDSETQWIEHVYPDDRDACIAGCDAAFEARRPFRMEYRLLHSSGEYRWIFSHGVPRFDQRGAFQGFVGCCTDVQELKSAQSELRREHYFLERLIDVSDRESEAVASSLHDRVLQPLLAAKMHVQSLSGVAGAANRGNQNLGLASKLLSAAADECLQIINRTRPLIIDEQGVQVAIQDLLAELNERGQTRFRLACDGELGRFPRLWEGSLYWIISEALQNVVRHSGARCATVTMTADQRMVNIEVRDDGNSFDPNLVGEEAFGLKAMEERALLFGGRFKLESAVGVGTTLSVTIPLPHELDD